MKPRKPAAASTTLAPELRPGQSLALLQELHILTREGRINQDTRRKLKQVNHLYQFIETLLKELEAGAIPQAPRGPGEADGPPGITVADHGAGKSYLGFILYDLFFRIRPDGWMYGIETRTPLVQRSRELAQAWGFGRMSFLDQSVAEATHSEALPAHIDLVTALHACDTATDDAIAFGLRKSARCFALVPCCQAECARLLNAHKALNLARTPLAELWRHPLHTREVGSQLTNVLRCLYLEACGYQVTVTELVGWEHSLKNELILARYTGRPRRSAALRLAALLDQFGLSEMLQTRFQAAQPLLESTPTDD
jgi:hypothetical protein